MFRVHGRQAAKGVALAALLLIVGTLISSAGAVRPVAKTAPRWPQARLTGTKVLKGQVPLLVHRSVVKAVRPHARAARLSLNFGLPLRDKAGLDRLIQQQALTHRYLTRKQLYARFAPPQAQVNALRRWLVSRGFRITHLGRDRLTVGASAPTATVERALHVKIADFVRPAFTFHAVKVKPYRFFSNTTAPRVPARLGVQTLSGLTDIDRFFTDYQLSGGSSKRFLVRSGGYFPTDLRGLYDVTGHGYDATGQTLGFTLWTAPETQGAMTAFAAATGDQPITVDPSCTATGNSPTQPSSCSTQTVAGDHLMTILENGNVDPGTNFGSNVETALDIEASHGVATHAGLKYYASECAANPPANSGLANAGCNGSDVGMEMALEDAANDPTLHSVSNSWGYGGEAEWGVTDPFVVNVNNILALGAAAGTSFYFSTGDAGTYQSGFPTDSPYVVSVGGTSTYSTSDPGTWSTSTTWSGAGSWCSTQFARPAWQTGAGVTANAACPGRVSPDESAVADPNTGVRFVSSTSPTTSRAGQVGGTSLSAPVLNGLQAVTQNFVNAQTYPGVTPKLGFMAPMLYQLGNSGHADSYFRDVDCGNTANPTSGPDGDAGIKGWDAATGWGEQDWFTFSTGVAQLLGATSVSTPASLSRHLPWTCAKTPSNSTERSISCPSVSVCYAVGASSGATPWYGKFIAAGAWGAVNTIFKSTDGGQTWFPSNSDMFSVACTGGSTCLTVGAGGRERRTTDGGDTWSDVATAPGNNKPLTQVECPSSTVCYAVGDRGNIMKSTDGGQTWSWEFGSSYGNPLYGLSCPSTTTCYAADIYAHVFKTTDGGANWAAQVTPITTPQVPNVAETGGPNPWGGLTGISCPDANTCVGVGIYATVSGQTNPNPDPPIVTTTDGGANWTRQVSGAGTGNFLQAVTCLPGTTTCWAVGRAGKILTTTDLTTWTAQTSNTTSYLNSVSCSSATSCIAVGQNGTVDVYDGTTWTPTTGNGGTGTLADVTCNGGSCYATGKQGITLVSANGGASWTIKAGGGSQANQLNGISCTSTTTCYAAGAAGTVLKTSNGGQSWLPQTSGTTQSLNGIGCGSASSCAAVGAAAGPTVLSAAAAVGDTNVKVASVTGFAVGQVMTIDTGANAESVTITAVGTAGATGTGITFTPALTLAHASGVVVSGRAAAIYTNDGSAWNAASGAGTSSLNGVACTSATSCAAVGAGGTILGSGDGGASWAARTSGTTSALNAVTCPSASCYTAGASGTILKSTDSGATWSPLTSGTTLAFNGIACAYEADCVADTSSGSTFLTVDGASWNQQGNPLSGPVSALNATSLALNGGFCTTARCLVGGPAQGDLLETPLLTVTVHTTSAPGTTPNLTLPASSSRITYSPASEAGNVTGTLTCQTTATSASPVGTYPISNCSGLSDDGFTVVYDYANSSHRVVTTPITTSQVSPASPDGANGWYVTAPVVTLTATAGDLAVAATHYTIDGGSEQTYSGPFSISTDGTHTVSFYSVDTDGNAETPHSITLKVDLHDPTSSASISPAAQNGWYASPTVTLSADDGAGSGVDHIVFSLDGGPFVTYTGPISGFSTGNHVIQFRAYDVAGRVEPLNQIAFKADSDPPTVDIVRPKDGDEFKLGQQVKANFKCTDPKGGSGIDTCVGDVQKGDPIDTSTGGNHTFTVVATDLAGNQSTVTVHYDVLLTAHAASAQLERPLAGLQRG